MTEANSDGTDLRVLNRDPTRELFLASVDRIEPDEAQPRKHFDQSEIDGLADSLRQHGQLQPIGVVKSGKVGRFILSFGERRWRAAKQLGWTEIECVVVPQKHARLFAILENVHRTNLNPVEEADAVGELAASMTPGEISRTLSKPAQYVSDCLSIRRLPEDLLDEVRRGAIKTSHSILSRIGRISDRAEFDKAVAELRAGQLTTAELKRRTKEKRTEERSPVARPTPQIRPAAIRAITKTLSAVRTIKDRAPLKPKDRQALEALRMEIDELLR